MQTPIINRVPTQFGQKKKQYSVEYWKNKIVELNKKLIEARRELTSAKIREFKKKTIQNNPPSNKMMIRQSGGV